MKSCERLKSIRESLGLSAKDFASKLNIGRSTITSYETGIRDIPERTLKDICRVYNVDYFWLTEGTGEMFTKYPDILIDDLAETYNLNDSEKELVKVFVKSSEDDRKAILTALKTLTNTKQ